MARTLTPTAWAAIVAQETDEVFAVLLELNHSSFSSPIRASSDNGDTLADGTLGTISNSTEFVFYPFEFIMPDQVEDAPPRARLSIDNIDRSIVAAVRGANGDPVSVTVQIVVASEPDTSLIGSVVFSLTNVKYDSLTVSGDLTFTAVLDEPYPEGVFGPSSFPGLF
jgi:hypothetical protein